MKLSKRLTSLANLVSSSDIVADIGCDHALLDIYLIKNNILPKILVTDINPNALESGKKNILKYHLNDYINAKLSDGINNLDNDINTLIISGMGTNTICNILNNPNIVFNIAGNKNSVTNNIILLVVFLFVFLNSS